jgi:HAD superfamily 5'-nucleotidase-like hydrolase
VGFDMDYTLAVYSMRNIEELAFRMTLERLVEKKGYPAEIARLQYDHAFVIRGLVVDKDFGNIFKMDRHNYVGRCYHGRKPLSVDERRALYQNEKIRLSLPRFAWIDTLFSLPEACLYAEIIEALEPSQPLDWHKLYDDVRDTIDEVHRDGSLKTELKRDLGRFIVPDPELAPTLHKLRSGGKKLFLLTNSLWDYTDEVMKHLLDNRSSAARSTRAATWWNSSGGPDSAARRCSTSATTSTATSSATERPRCGGPASSCRSWSGRSSTSTRTPMRRCACASWTRCAPSSTT